MKNKLLILLFWVFAPSCILAVSDAQFLNIAVQPRALGLAGAYSAVVDDPGASYWNPARLYEVNGSEIMFTHQKWMFETDLEFLSVASKLPFGTFGLSVVYLHMPKISIFGEDGQALGDASIYDMAVTGSYASRLLGIPVGVNLKYINKVVDEIRGAAFAIDLGLSYDFHFLKMGKSAFPNLTLSMVIRNLGTHLDYGAYQSSLPTSLVLGFKYGILGLKKHRLFLSGDLNAYWEDGFFAALGTEYLYQKKIAFRSGLQWKNETLNPMAGVGLYYDMSSFNIVVDAALFRYSNETVYCFSLGFRNALDIRQTVSITPVKKETKKELRSIPQVGKVKVGFVNFKNLGQQKAFDFLKETIPENVKMALAQNTNVSVIETDKVNEILSAIQTDSDQEMNYHSLYYKLGLRHLVMGSFLDINDSITVNVKIVDVANNEIIYTKSLSGYSGKNLFSLIDKITTEITGFYGKKE